MINLSINLNSIPSLVAARPGSWCAVVLECGGIPLPGRRISRITLICGVERCASSLGCAFIRFQPSKARQEEKWFLCT